MSDKPVARPLPIHRTTQQRINAYTDINAFSGIRTHDPNVRASEDSHALYRTATVTGTLSLGGHKYRDLALQVRGWKQA
jgi:hypothetical protein